MSELTAFNSSKTELKKGVTLLEASAGTGKTYALARILTFGCGGGCRGKQNSNGDLHFCRH